LWAQERAKHYTSAALWAQGTCQYTRATLWAQGTCQSLHKCRFVGTGNVPNTTQVHTSVVRARWAGRFRPCEQRGDLGDLQCIRADEAALFVNRTRQRNVTCSDTRCAILEASLYWNMLHLGSGIAQKGAVAAAKFLKCTSTLVNNPRARDASLCPPPL
jgi:hypothetical protein